MTGYQPEVEWLLRMGDTLLVLGHRLSEWCGHTPVLEEDLAISNTALDLLGQARRWLTYAGEMEGRGRDEDAFAFGRDSHEFRNLLLVEQDNGSYADTIARQFYFDCWHAELLQALTVSTDERVAAMAAQARTEVAYHLRRSLGLVLRLGDGTAESHARMQSALDELWIFTGEMFEHDDVDATMLRAGAGVDSSTLHCAWLARVTGTLHEAKLRLPPPSGMRSGGRHGKHGEVLGYLLAEMQFLPRAYPGAKW